MNRMETWLLHISTLVVGGTGILYAVFRYLMEPVDPFAVVNHPLEPFVRNAHILSAPFLILAVGLIVHAHIVLKLANGASGGRKSGVLMIPLFGVMVLSGYFLQTVVSERTRNLLLITHVGSGLLWMLFYGVHQVASYRTKKMMAQRQNGIGLKRTIQMDV